MHIRFWGFFYYQIFISMCDDLSPVLVDGSSKGFSLILIIFCKKKKKKKCVTCWHQQLCSCPFDR